MYLSVKNLSTKPIRICWPEVGSKLIVASISVTGPVRNPALKSLPLPATSEALSSWHITLDVRLVLGCINADFGHQIVILPHFSRSTRFAHFCTARNSNFWRNFQNYLNFVPEICQHFRKFLKILINFLKKIEFRAVQKCANLVDLEKCWIMTIWLQKSALI